MMLELNEVLIEGMNRTLSLMAKAGELTCLTGGTAEQRTRWLLAMQGFETVTNGYISIDGEPLTSRSATVFRKLMAYAPARLCELGEVTTYEPPSVQDVFSLRSNLDLPISNGILSEEMRRVGADVSDPRVQLIAVAALLNKKILFVDNPPVLSADYMKNLASQGRVVLVTSSEEAVLKVSDVVVEL
jgi:putative ABC transport system ATP-binding protein/ATP-binding cassette subfamily C protein CydD